MYKIKATDKEAVALELEKASGLLGGIIIRGRFEGDVVIARILPKIVLWRAFLESRLMGFPQELVFLSEHPDMIVELSQLCLDIKAKKVSVLLESPSGLVYIEDPEGPNRQRTNIICRPEAKNTAFYTDDEINNATIWFYGPKTTIVSTKFIVVDKKEFLEALKKLLE